MNSNCGWEGIGDGDGDEDEDEELSVKPFRLGWNGMGCTKLVGDKGRGIRKVRKVWRGRTIPLHVDNPYGLRYFVRTRTCTSPK